MPKQEIICDSLIGTYDIPEKPKGFAEKLKPLLTPLCAWNIIESSHYLQTEISAGLPTLGKPDLAVILLLGFAFSVAVVGERIFEAGRQISR